MNLTKRSDGQWRALKNDEIVKMTKYLGAVYRAELATELQNIGYEIRNEDKGLFELAHISKEQIIEFSKRSRHIEQKLEEQGLSREDANTKQKQQATLISRKPKVSVKREIIFENWQKQVQSLGIDFNSYKNQKSNNRLLKEKEVEAKEDIITPDQLVKIEAAKRALNFAINHLTQDKSYVDERTLINTAMNKAKGATNFLYIENEIKNQVQQNSIILAEPLYAPAVEVGEQQGNTKQEWIKDFTNNGMNQLQATNYFKEMIRNGDLVKLEPQYTTPSLLAREKQILQIESRAELNKVQVHQNEKLREAAELTKLATQNNTKTSELGRYTKKLDRFQEKEKGN